MSVYQAALPTVRPAVRSAFEQGSGGGAASIIAGLFAQGQQGFWLPFTDFASLSQDSAGTLPYTALEQPVGRVLDRSGRGNHASQATSTARGVVSARVNVLQNTQAFEGVVWSKIAAGTGIAPLVTENYGLAPDGAMTACRVRLNLNGGTGSTSNISQFYTSTPVVSGVSYTQKFWVKSLAGNATLSQRDDQAAVVNQNINITNAWQSFEASGSATAASSKFGLWLRGAIGTSDSADFLLWHPSMTLTSQSALPFQAVNTPTDYGAIGFPKSLRVEVDDFYTCGGGGSTTGFFYSDFIRPMGGAGTRRVIWSDRSGNNGYELAINASDKLELSAGNGTTITAVASTVSAALAEGKQYEVMDNGAVLSVQIDGSAAVTVARPVVTAGSSTITLYRGASTGYFNGQITEPIYRAGPPPSAYEREVIRNYQMQKAGMA